MSLNINGYIIPELTTADAGMCRWGFGQKNGHDFFIKEFLSPRYPTDSGKLGPELTHAMRTAADEFFARKAEFYRELAKCRTGNNMIVLDFFRCGSKYYAVTDRVSGSMVDFGAVKNMSTDSRYTLIKSLLYSAAAFHERGIVHADLKPDNVLIRRTSAGYCTAKIIDFDSGFLQSRQPDTIEGTQNYFSPEALKKTNGMDAEVTTAADVFALGLLIHQLWCGVLPAFPKAYNYASEAVLSGASIVLGGSVPGALADLILRMLSLSPEDRPTARSAWETLCGITG